MSWNYRVMKHTDPKGNEDWLAIHEVYYSGDQVDDLTVPADQIGYSKEEATVYGEDLEQLRWALEHMLKALEKPVLDYE